MCFGAKVPNPGTPPPPQLPVQPPKAVNQQALDSRQQNMMAMMRARGLASTNRQGAGMQTPQAPGARTLLGPAPGAATGGY